MDSDAYHEHTDVETLRDLFQEVQELPKLLLSFGKLTTSKIVNTKACHNAVDYQETELAADKQFTEFLEEFKLLFAVVATRVGNILKRRVRIN